MSNYLKSFASKMKNIIASQGKQVVLVMDLVSKS